MTHNETDISIYRDLRCIFYINALYFVHENVENITLNYQS